MSDSSSPVQTVRLGLRRIPRAHGSALLFYLAAAVVVTWPLVTVIGTRLAGDAFSDATELSRHIWWIKHALQTGQPLYWQPLLGYPNGMPGAWLWGNPLQSFPAWFFAFLMPIPAAYNVTLLLRLTLNGWAMYLLVNYLTRGQSRFGAGFAGLIFLAYPTFQGQIAGGHLGLLALWPGIFYVYGLVRLRETPTVRWLVWCAAFLVLALGGSILLLIYWLIPVTLFFMALLLIERQRRTLILTTLAAVIGGAVSMIFVLPVLLETLQASDGGQIGGAVRYSADLLALVTPSFYHPLFTGLDYTHRVLGTNTVEGPGYIGTVAAVLSGLAVWRVPSARKWLALALAVWVLSLGPLLKINDQPVTLDLGEYQTYVTLPWAWVQNLPVLSIARTPARFNFTVALAVSVMAGYGASWALARIRRVPVRGVLVAAGMALMLWEYQFFWTPPGGSPTLPELPTMPGVVPAEIAALAARDDVRAVFDMPWYHLLTDKDALYLQTGHQRPLIAGHVTRQTPVNPALLTVLQETLDPALLDAAGADVVILHKDWDDEGGALDAFTRAQLGDPFYEDIRIAAFAVPEPTQSAAFTVVLPDSAIITDGEAVYAFAPEPGWVTFSAVLDADGRDVALSLNGEMIHRWVITGETPVRVSVPIREAGYFTLALTVTPACPDNHAPALTCRTLTLHDVSLDGFQAALAAAEPVRFEDGLTLLGASVGQDADVNVLDVGLWWQFDEARTSDDVRFVHVLDTDGQLVAQRDGTLGAQVGGTQWAEHVRIDLPVDLPGGTYTVYTGWYTYPVLARFGVQSALPRAQDGLLYIGSFTNPET